MIEWCVMMEQFPGEVHRGPWPEWECVDWIQEALDDGCRPGAFYLAFREISPWEKYND